MEIPTRAINKAGFLYSAAMIMLALLVLIAALPVTAAGASYKDVPDSSPCYPYITYLSGQDLVSGFPDGSFRPAESITRAEITVMLARAAGLAGQQPASPTFSDVDGRHWAFGYIEAAVKAGMLKGYPDGTFKPDRPISRAEAASLTLGLSGRPVPVVALPGQITDVDSRHWARNQVAAALDAGLFDPAESGKFAPDLPANRAQAARGLAVMLTIMPGRAPLPSTGTLKPTGGTVLLKMPGLDFREIDTEAPCPVGSEIKTGPDGRAELNFPDGSGLRIEPGTHLAIKQCKGQPTILKDGSSGTLVDFLEFSVSGGKVFGALAAGYTHKDKVAGTTASRQAAAPLRKNLLAGTVLTGEFLLAQAGEADLPWWEDSQAQAVRVQVDMPWGVAGVRGTFWMNRVTESSNDLSVVDGMAQLSAAGETEGVGAGTVSFITGPGNPPSQASGMPGNLLGDWEEAEQWVRERAQAIQDRLPASSPPNPGVASGILRSFNNSLHGPAPLGITGFDPADNSTLVPADKTITVTFNADIQAGDAFDGIALQGPGGGEAAADISIKGNTLVIEPAGGLEQDVPVSGAIVLDFDLPLSEKQTAIRLSGGGTSAELPAAVQGTKLTAPYSGLALGTTYTVTIPQGTVESLEHGTGNDEISWTFITQKEPR